MSEYRDLGVLAASINHTIALSCHHCKVMWTGCAAESCCPQCGRPKGYWPHDAGLCYCDECALTERSNES